MRHVRLRPVLFGLASALAIVSTATPAEAEVIQVTDPRGDEPEARGDILRFRLQHGDWVVLTLRPRRPANPFTSSAWQEGVSRVEWQIDTNGRGSVAGWEYWGYLDAANGRLRAEVIRNGGVVTCRARASFPNASAYQIRFRRSCIGNPARIKIYGWLLYDTDLSNRGAETFDRFPDRGWSSPVDYG